MFKQEVRNQVTNDSNVVNIATKDNLDIKMWKHQNIKEFNKELNTIEKSKNMKQYFTSEELNDLLFVTHLIDLNSKMLKKWIDRGNLLEEEVNLLNMGSDYTSKFLEMVLSRMPLKEVEKFMKRTIKAKKDPVRIVDKWMQDRVFGTFETEYEIVKIERPQFEKLALIGVNAHCKDCNDHYNNCDMYYILEDAMIPRAEIKNNCPYAFISKKKKQEIAEKKKAREEKKATKSERAKRKKANRFDEDEEVIEYNFTPKGR